MTRRTQSEAANFMALVSDPAVTMPAGAKIHQDYLAKATTDGFRYGPKRDNARKIKPNILPFALLSPAVRASNVGPFESVFGYVTEQVTARELQTLEELQNFVQSLLDSDGKKVPSLELGERTWKVWAGYARKAEPTHPNLVANYDLLDTGTKDYDLQLNATAVKYLLSLIEAAIAKRDADQAVAV